jgi:thiamine monophosphate kinase
VVDHPQGNPSGEDSLIARYFRPIAIDPGAFNLDDDAAALKAGGDDIVVTTDAIVEGVHFLPDDPPDTVARKALRVNLSDLAAKGAAPAGFVLTLALRAADETWLKAFAQAARLAGVQATSIGMVAAGVTGPKFIDSQGREIGLKRLSYSHF